MRVSDELILAKKEEKKPKKAEKVEKLVEDEAAWQAVEQLVPEEIQTVDLASENLRISEEDDAIAEREAEWRIAKAQHDERRRLERLARERQEEERRQTDQLCFLADPNCSVLADPAVASVVTKKNLFFG